MSALRGHVHTEGHVDQVSVMLRHAYIYSCGSHTDTSSLAVHTDLGSRHEQRSHWGPTTDLCPFPRTRSTNTGLSGQRVRNLSRMHRALAETFVDVLVHSYID